jgi:hypothetical protein
MSNTKPSTDGLTRVQRARKPHSDASNLHMDTRKAYSDA